MVFFDIFSKKRVRNEERAKIIVDNRERNSLLIPELYGMNFEIEFRQLNIGDYIVKGVVIERKTINDLKSSIIDKRIVSQLIELKQHANCLLIIEGISEQELYKGILHENAIRGFLLSIALKHKIPFIFTRDARDSARYLMLIAKKKCHSEVSLRAFKAGKSDEEKMQFILEGFPYIGSVKAKKLILQFYSIKNIVNASAEELQGILGKRAADFKELVEREIPNFKN